ncbi:4-hydroxybenzoate polyprenyltransferase [Povalibacter uvarum]|uniref:4-hydroxybenzoate polyprenyltransferase n=1 Tax=Povalibacter uvarum TaxID=732238 RepID=A0A841HL52_9GAMM|nr:UbiA family prenyltransferase [Povalibacter uvarum]MBB6093473.1 4-hydroxybenzoate polyprenyltransferase [Povalibacter uvarum]
MNIKPLLALCRASNLPTVWMNVLAAALLSDPGATVSQIVTLALALSCFYCGGMAMNDLCDLTFDRVHQPYRPIVAGRLSRAAAQAAMGLLFLTGYALLATAPSSSGLVGGLGLLGVIWIYNAFHKQHRAAVFVMGVARLMVYVVTALSLTGDINAAVWLAATVQTIYVVVLTVVARAEHLTPSGRYGWPIIPWMIALMPLVDGAVLAFLLSPIWLFAGVIATALTRLGQRYVRGD